MSLFKDYKEITIRNGILFRKNCLKDTIMSSFARFLANNFVFTQISKRFLCVGFHCELNPTKTCLEHHKTRHDIFYDTCNIHRIEN
jgi:hypothetical protein